MIEARHPILLAIGGRMRARRLALSMTARDVAAAAGMRMERYRSLEAAVDGTFFRLFELFSIAQALQISPGALVDGVSKEVGLKRVKYLPHPRAESLNIFYRIMRHVERLQKQEVFDRILGEIEKRPYGKIAAEEIRLNGVPYVSPIPKTGTLPVKWVDR